MRTRRSGGPTALSGGYTVLEMTITLLFVSLILIIAMRMVLDAQARVAHSGQRNLDMSVDQAFAQLRIDIRGSRVFGLGYVPGEWQTQPLVLEGHFSGDVIVYEAVAGDLRRVIYEPDKLEPLSWRIVLQNVSYFRWRQSPLVPSATAELDILYQEVGPLTARSEGAGQVSAGGVQRQRVLMVRPRDVTGARWW